MCYDKQLSLLGTLGRHFGVTVIVSSPIHQHWQFQSSDFWQHCDQLAASITSSLDCHLWLILYLYKWQTLEFSLDLSFLLTLYDWTPSSDITIYSQVFLCQHSPVFLQSSDITVKCSYTKVLALPCVIACLCHRMPVSSHACVITFLWHHSPVCVMVKCHCSLVPPPMQVSSNQMYQSQDKCSSNKATSSTPVLCHPQAPCWTSHVLLHVKNSDLIHEALLNNWLVKHEHLMKNL